MADRLRTAAQQALEALQTELMGYDGPVPHIDSTISALRAALAQVEPVQPAAGVDAYDMIDRFLRNNLRDDDYAEYSAALDSLYTAPQQAEPVQPVACSNTFGCRCPKHFAAQQAESAQSKPLTEEEIYEMYNEPRSDAEMVEFARAIERAHGIKDAK